MRKDFLMPLNLQFFAEPDDDSKKDDDKDSNGGSSDDSDDEPDDSDDSDDDSGKDKGKSKTFTQTEVKRMMTKEKREGRKAMLNSLGFKTEEEAKKASAFYNSYVESQKTDAEKDAEKQKSLEDDKSSAEKRAEEAEMKLACLMAGVNKESVEDIMAIAKNKVTEDTSLEDVLGEMRKQPKYSTFFEESEDKQKDDGTGNNSGHTKKKGDEKKGSYGKRLAESTSKSSGKKSSYF